MCGLSDTTHCLPLGVRAWIQPSLMGVWARGRHRTGLVFMQRHTDVFHIHTNLTATVSVGIQALRCEENIVQDLFISRSLWWIWDRDHHYHSRMLTAPNKLSRNTRGCPSFTRFTLYHLASTSIRQCYHIIYHHEVLSTTGCPWSPLTSADSGPVLYMVDVSLDRIWQLY